MKNWIFGDSMDESYNTPTHKDALTKMGPSMKRLYSRND